LNPQQLNHKANAQPIMFHDNSYNFRITLSLLTFNHNLKTMHKIKYHTIGIHTTWTQVLSHNKLLSTI